MRVIIGTDVWEVSRQAYGYCPECGTYHDSWKEGDFHCPYCDRKLDELNPSKVREALQDCIDDGCFNEDFAYDTPLRPQIVERIEKLPSKPPMWGCT